MYNSFRQLFSISFSSAFDIKTNYSKSLKQNLTNFLNKVLQIT